MNATEMTLKNPSRQRRIKIASRIFQALILLIILANIYVHLGIHFGWPISFGEDKRALTTSHTVILIPQSNGKIHSLELGNPSTPPPVPPTIYWLEMVRNGLALFGGVVLLRLFWLYGKGIIFSAQNVVCIRFFGYYLIINWLINYIIQGLEVQSMHVSSEPIFAGLLIIFIAWIMDEGRKIQEEQELTV